jgi:hypothetical protein
MNIRIRNGSENSRRTPERLSAAGSKRSEGVVSGRPGGTASEFTSVAFKRPTSATGAFVVPGAARCSEVSGAGQWQSLYLLLSGRKVRSLLLERDWMFNADASREARG